MYILYRTKKYAQTESLFVNLLNFLILQKQSFPIRKYQVLRTKHNCASSTEV